MNWHRDVEDGGAFGWDPAVRAAMQSNKLRRAAREAAFDDNAAFAPHEEWLSRFQSPLAMAAHFALVQLGTSSRCVAGKSLCDIVVPLGSGHQSDRMVQYMVRKTLHALSCTYPSFAPALASYARRDVALIAKFFVGLYAPSAGAHAVYRRLMSFGDALAERVDEALFAGTSSIDACVERVLLDPLFDFDVEPPHANGSVVLALALSRHNILEPLTAASTCNDDSGVAETVVRRVAECIANTTSAPIDQLLLRAMHTSIRAPDYHRFVAGVWEVAHALVAQKRGSGASMEGCAAWLAVALCTCGDIGELEDFIRSAVGLPAHQPPRHPRHRARYLTFKAALVHVGEVDFLVAALATREVDGAVDAPLLRRWVGVLCVCTCERMGVKLLAADPRLVDGLLRSLGVDSSTLPLRVSTPLDVLVASPSVMMDAFGEDDGEEPHEPEQCLSTLFLNAAVGALDGEAGSGGDAYEPILRCLHRFIMVPFESLSHRWRRVQRKLQPALDAAMRRHTHGVAFDSDDSRGLCTKQLRARMAAALAVETCTDAWCRPDVFVAVVSTWRGTASGHVRVHASRVLTRACREAPDTVGYECETLLRRACACGVDTHLEAHGACADGELTAVCDQSACTWRRIKFALRLQILDSVRAGVYCFIVREENMDEGA
jgi:hypothetical protein